MLQKLYVVAAIKLRPMEKLESDLCGGGNALALARARADVLTRAALIIRARALLEEAMSAPATRVRPFLIKVACFRLANRMATTSTVILNPPPSP